VASFLKLADAGENDIFLSDEDDELFSKEKEKLWDQDQHDQTLQMIK